MIWALSTNVDPARDITVIENTPIDYLDFASPVSGLGSKLGIDATAKMPPETQREWGRKIRMTRRHRRSGHAQVAGLWSARQRPADLEVRSRRHELRRPTDTIRDRLACSPAAPGRSSKRGRILERYREAPPEKGYVLFETGYGPSGLPHIGTFGEVARTTMVRRAFALLSDMPTRLFAFSDDMDGLRKVPDNVPNQEMLRRHLGRPLTSIPDPFGTHESFGAHNNARLRALSRSVRLRVRVHERHRLLSRRPLRSRRCCWRCATTTTSPTSSCRPWAPNGGLPTARSCRSREKTGRVLQAPVVERDVGRRHHRLRG